MIDLNDIPDRSGIVLDQRANRIMHNLCQLVENSNAQQVWIRELAGDRSRACLLEDARGENKEANGRGHPIVAVVDRQARHSGGIWKVTRCDSHGQQSEETSLHQCLEFVGKWLCKAEDEQQPVRPSTAHVPMVSD